MPSVMTVRLSGSFPLALTGVPIVHNPSMSQAASLSGDKVLMGFSSNFEVPARQLEVGQSELATLSVVWTITLCSPAFPEGCSGPPFVSLSSRYIFCLVVVFLAQSLSFYVSPKTSVLCHRTRAYKLSTFCQQRDQGAERMGERNPRSSDILDATTGHQALLAGPDAGD
jgi:hypothetical protein